MTNLSDLEAQISALEQRLGQTVGLVAEFDSELAGLGRNLTFTGREVDGLSRSFSTGLRRAFDGVIFDGMRMQDALRGIAQSMAGSVYNTAMKPVQNAFGSLLAQGVSGAMGSIMPFAKGGVISQATAFPMRGCTGLMGEAGPEAIMPLSRGPDGRLGVRAAGGGGAVHVSFNIQTPDVAGFQRSQTQIAAQMGRLLSQGNRNR
ncbi:phage tail tape measure protein [Roseinatronobacter monicus]|uniref:Lambda family phage tail tape measure protein n=1 Tax=Roseinatronobacter monicus TaxID=393481 RepID=A0A543KGT3_9RHOB|nr:phage tail tape measure protein [Roseinatronobacter monicus]TQM94289.1 lambda family phage tail tape measure protein [Roseinatronobacter monicus]